MWPSDLRSVSRRGDISTTELWMLKERIDHEIIKPVKRPEKTSGDKDQWYTVYSAKGFETYIVLTKGNPESGDRWCLVLAVNRLTEEQASKYLACYPPWNP
jgi:hypothetical protein